LGQTPSLPDADPRSDRPRCGGRESKFLAGGDYWEKWNQMCADAATFTVRVEALSKGAVSDAFLAPIIGQTGFVSAWQKLGKTPNRFHEVTSNLVPPHLIERLRRAGEAY